MRVAVVVAVVLALLIAAASAGAQEAQEPQEIQEAQEAPTWKEYAYPRDFFSVAFPADPKVETGAWQAADGRAVTARVYAAAQGGGVFRMTVADLPDPALQDSAVLDHAVRMLAQGKTIKVDISHRINRVYGRQLSLTAPDGSYSSVAVFFHKQRLYQIEGTALPGAANASADAIRFQQSLAFTDGATNR
jgi:hypothetical protein